MKRCPVVTTIDIIGKKWAVLIIRDLLTGKKRFGELLTSLTGISPRTLSARLVDLERGGAITREAFAEMPPRVEYGLTKRGEALHDILSQMAKWGDLEHYLDLSDPCRREGCKEGCNLRGRDAA